jgi:hypothetical protein
MVVRGGKNCSRFYPPAIVSQFASALALDPGSSLFQSLMAFALNFMDAMWRFTRVRSFQPKRHQVTLTANRRL